MKIKGQIIEYYFDPPQAGEIFTLPLKNLVVIPNPQNAGEEPCIVFGKLCRSKEYKVPH
jgi:hypothetical protein